MSARLALMAMIVALAGCGAAGGVSESEARPSAENGAQPATANAAGVEQKGNVKMAEDWTAGGCPKLPDHPPFAIGRSEADLSGAYGKPDSSGDFVLGRGLDPSRMTILNVLPLPANAERTVREIGWTRAGCSLTVWLVKRDGAWTSVQAVRSPSDGEA